MSGKRKCIFTGEDSDFKLNIAHEDHHNWAKYIPTTKAYYEAYLKNRPLNELEMRQVELFFQMELCKIKQLKLMDRMEVLRGEILEGMDSFNTVEKLRFYKPDIQFSEEMEQDIREKVKENKPIAISHATQEEMEGLPNEDRVITVSEKDWDKLQDHIENPPEPTPALVEATKRYREEFGFEEDENGILYKDDPGKPMSLEAFEEIKNKEVKILSTPKKDDKIKKKKVVKKKKPTLWD